MDFMSDKLHNNIRFRTFNVIDDYNREVLGIDIGISISSLRVWTAPTLSESDLLESGSDAWQG